MEEKSEAYRRASEELDQMMNEKSKTQEKTLETPRLDVDPESLTGSELQRRLNLSYNPEMLLLATRDLENEICNLGPNIGVRIYNSLMNAGAENVYDVVTKIKRWDKGLGYKTFSSLQNFFRERFRLEMGQAFPPEVLAWYKSKSGR